MSQAFARYPTKTWLFLSVIFLMFVSVPFLLGLFVHQTIGISISAIILLLLTRMLYKCDGTRFTELGLDFDRRNISFLVLGIALGCLFFILLFVIQMTSNDIHVQLNKNVNYFSIATGLFLLIPPVLVEELIFRGYSFKRTVDKAGVTKTNLIFAFLFLVWHWIALDAWGNFYMMAGLLTTAFGHLLFSTALIRSGTLYFPIGIHLGNNWTSHHFFSSTTRGIRPEISSDSFFIVTMTADSITPTHHVLNYAATIIYALLFTWIIWKWKTAPSRNT